MNEKRKEMDWKPAEFHCGYSETEQDVLAKGCAVLKKYQSFLNHSLIVDLGCGEGALLLALKRAGHNEIIGVDSNEELLRIAGSFDLPLIAKDIWEYLESETLLPAVYFYVDVMEHVPVEQNLELLKRLPFGSRLIIQTPYTESVLGHRYYMNVPSHVAPYSPWVIKKMLQRFGYEVVSDGSVDWAHPPTWKNKIRAFLLLQVMGVDPDLFLGGGNYFVVADRARNISG